VPSTTKFNERNEEEMKLSGKFEGKVALVTGGGSGIGRAAALAFAREKAKVVIADVRVKDGREVVQMIKQKGGDAIFIEVDVSKAIQVEVMINKAVEKYGRLDYAFNNAGVDARMKKMNPIEEEKDWDRVIDINLKGVWLCTKYEVPHMIKCGGGAIVNTASVAGLTGLGVFGAYGASKHGVVGLTRDAALQYAKYNIRVNALCPAYTFTNLGRNSDYAKYGREGNQSQTVPSISPTSNPIARWSTPEEQAEAVVWLCSDAASYITGVALPVDGGLLAGYRT
jgi:NAD(P)-dependent dehydrogenase (short-subunit alcohol dehydrogenase family)